MGLTPRELLVRRRAEILSRVKTMGGQEIAWSPLSLGSKLRRWIHPNDDTQVTESEGVVASIADKGTTHDAATAIGSPTISSGVVSFDGNDQGLEFGNLLNEYSDSEFFAAISCPDDGVFLITSSDEQSTNNYIAFGIREQSDNDTHAEWNTNDGGTLDQVWDELSDIGTAVAVVNFRINSDGDGYIMGVDGVEASGDDLTAENGTDSGDWVDVPDIENAKIGVLTTSGGDTFYEGALGKSGFIETGPLTDSQRAALVAYMVAESVS